MFIRIDTAAIQCFRILQLYPVFFKESKAAFKQSYVPYMWPTVFFPEKIKTLGRIYHSAENTEDYQHQGSTFWFCLCLKYLLMKYR